MADKEINTNGWRPPDIKMVQERGILKLNSNAHTFSYSFNVIGENNSILFLSWKVTYPDGTYREGEFDLGTPSTNGGQYKNDEVQIGLNQNGEYELNITCGWAEGKKIGDSLFHQFIAQTCVLVADLNSYSSPLKPYTLGATIERLLDVTPVHKQGEKNKYKFSVYDSVELGSESPEFAFTGHTLFEALLMIAQYMGSFPVLEKNDFISFRKLWNGRRISEEDLPAPIDEISSSDINQYCTYLETEVQNLVGVNDSRAGSIVEPYAGGYKTTRAADGSEISQDTAVISTDYNMYQHIKQEIGYIGNDLPADNDLTAYVYESGDYYTLTDRSAAYPASKAYALCWEHMGKNVTELSHRIKTNSEISKLFNEPALANIINAKTGESYNSGIVGYIQNLIDVNNGDSFADLMFRTTYIPVINSRITQYKDYFGNFHYDGSLKYNQTAELVDSEMYGEHLKQLVRKLGNVTKRKVYIFNKIDDVPEVGTLVDGYSVYDVQTSIRENKVIATISYVKYAELSRYIGVKNPWKDSDVSIDKCYNRQVSINEFILYTHDKNRRPAPAPYLRSAALAFPDTSASPITCVCATGYTADKTPLNTVLLPVVSLAMGNSIMFQWQYRNNYSAGNMSEEAPDEARSVISGTKFNRAQKAVKYADMYGRLQYYDFEMFKFGPVPGEFKGLFWIEEADAIKRRGTKGGDFSGTIRLTVDNYSADAYVTISVSPYPVDITVSYNLVLENTAEVRVGPFECKISAGQNKVLQVIKRSEMNSTSAVKGAELISAKCYDIENTKYFTDEKDILRHTAHSLPLLPRELRYPDLSTWDDPDVLYGSPLIAGKKLLVEKDSSEALSFSVQLHNCTDDENFIIGSGLTNFCPLIGGKAEGLALYGFNSRINIFDRRISVDGNGVVKLTDKITPKTVGDKLKIDLPDDINKYNAWAYVGEDKDGNHQVIIGENRDLDGSDFDTELFILPMSKLEGIL